MEERDREWVIKYEVINQVCVRGLVLWDIFKKIKQNRLFGDINHDTDYISKRNECTLNSEEVEEKKTNFKDYHLLIICNKKSRNREELTLRNFLF